MTSAICKGFLALTISWAAIAQAQAQEAVQDTAQQGDTASGGIGDIVVTAQKRAENVQDIPIAITAVGGDTLRERQVGGIEQLVTVAPSLNFGTYGGAARIAVRGIGFDTINPGSEGRVAYHVDGVYISRPSAQLGTFFDVDRVEVLRGPQGTLYGRNATGGSINVVTRAPTDRPSGYVDLTVGNYGRVAVEAALSGPLAEGVSARVAVTSNNRDGYGLNEHTGNRIDNANQRGARAVVRVEPTSSLTLDLAADFYRESDNAYGLHYFGQYDPTILLAGVRLGGNAPTRARNINSDRDPKNRRELYGFSGTATLDLGAVTLKSITGYRHSDYRVETELDMTELPLSYFPFFERAHQFSQEVQLSGDSGPIKWLVGGYYFKEHIFGGSQVTRNLQLAGGADRMVNGYRVEGDTHTRATALFGQVDFAVSDQFKLIAGARYGSEKISIDDIFQLDFVNTYNPNDPIRPLPGFPRSASTKDNSFTPKLGVEFKPADDLLLYATASRGYKSGGFNLGVNRPAFSPEDIWSYEAGLKFTSSDRIFRGNLATFYYDYSNLQVSKVVNSSVITENAASADLYGGELELTLVPTPDFQIDGGLSYLQTKYKDFLSSDPGRPGQGDTIDPVSGQPAFNLSGKSLIQAPKWTANIGAQYGFDAGPGRFTLRGEMNYVSRVYFTAFNVDQVSQPKHAKFNAYLNFESDDGHWRGSLFVRNIGDKVTIANALMSSILFGAPVTGSVSAPRTFGARIAYGF